MPARRSAPPLVVLLCLCLVTSLSGCGPSGPPRGVVFGKVTFDGAPVESGSIQFVPTGPGGGPTSGAEIKSGTYRTPDQRGPVLGPHRVEITAHRAGKGEPSKGIAGAQAGPSAAGGSAMEMYIPEKFNKKSELTLDVKAGDNPKDFALTSK